MQQLFSESFDNLAMSLLWDAEGEGRNMRSYLTATIIICVKFLCYACDNKTFVVSRCVLRRRC